jgi:hypothetical protein
MPKSSKRFILSNEKLNSQGFVVKTAGIDISDFLKNPIMFWMHKDGSDKDDTSMPIGFWEDVRKEGDQLTAVPNFNDKDAFAMKIYDMVEHGTLRAASVALENPMTFDTNRANWVKGQTIPTVLTSKLGEASIVDRGANSNAVTLNDGANSIYLSMAAKPAAQLIGNDTPSEEHSPEIKDILKNAVTVGKLTQSQADSFLKMPTHEDAVKSIKGIIQSSPINPDRIQGRFHHTLIKQAQKSWEDITRKDAGGMNFMKSGAPELYRAKFFEKHGRMPAVLQT